MQAYDLHIIKRPYDANDPEHQGWIFGKPRGIESRHWPIDPNSGYPLMHGFTLRLPEDHRVHGPEVVALSFFATAPDHNDGMPTEGLVIADLLKAHPDSAPTDEGLAPIWKHAREEHSRLHRMQDVLGCEYAVVLLTEEEFLGAECAVPEWVNSPALSSVPRPGWLDPHKNEAQGTNSFLDKILGGSPSSEANFSRAIRCTPRKNDPNAGIKAEEFPDETSPYKSPYDSETFEDLEWAKDHANDHIGGTMRPIQGVPDFSPHYIGFEEYFGDYNFGGGNAQLDFLHMKFDWACG